jgi:uncharacterized membrane protein
VIGLIAATALTIDKLNLLRDPRTALSCDISPLVGCARGLESWQGALLQFPNSIVGMAAWSALLVVGLILLTRTRLTRLVWIGLNAGLTVAFALVVFLIGQSIYVLGVLCPWCMVTWAVTIPCFLAVSLFNLAHWSAAPSLRQTARQVLQWVPLITFGCFAAIAVLAQLRLNLLGSL